MASRLSEHEQTRISAFEAKRMEILKGVAFVFAEEGYHQTSVNSLASRLGISKPVLYYYAKDKDDLFYQCGAMARTALDEALEDARLAKISGIGKIRRFFSKYTEIMCGDFGRCLLLVDRNALSPRTAELDVFHRRQIEQAMQNMIVDGQADGSIGPCDPVMATRALFSAFNGIPRWFRADGKLSLADVAQTYLDLFVTGMGRG